MPAEMKTSKQVPAKVDVTAGPSTPLTVKSASSSQTPQVQSPEDWYASGERVWYSLQSQSISIVPCDDAHSLQVFRRVVKPLGSPSAQRWMTLLPNDPEGSFGYHQVEEALAKGKGFTTSSSKGRCDTDCTEVSMESFLRTQGTCKAQDDNDDTTRFPLPRLHVDYVGQGDSDSLVSPQGTSLAMQRADLVEAQWHDLGIQRTVVVSAGEASALVVMELLQRQRLRLAAGSPFPKILHVLALNGRFVAKTRHATQLPPATQLLRSSMGPTLANKARRSDLVLSQLLSPSLAGCSTRVKKQVASVVRRNEGCFSLIDMARTVEDHLFLSHRYRWHLAHLLKVFLVDQGITVTLLRTSKNRAAARQGHLVRQQVDEYDLADNLVHYQTIPGPSSTTAFLLDAKPDQSKRLVEAIWRLQDTEIPLSSNSGGVVQELAYETEDDDNEGDDTQIDQEMAAAAVVLDTLLETEIEFDVNDMDDDDFDLF
jgi:hypothetical protein